MFDNRVVVNTFLVLENVIFDFCSNHEISVIRNLSTLERNYPCMHFSPSPSNIVIFTDKPVFNSYYQWTDLIVKSFHPYLLMASQLFFPPLPIHPVNRPLKHVRSSKKSLYSRLYRIHSLIYHFNDAPLQKIINSTYSNIGSSHYPVILLFSHPIIGQVKYNLGLFFYYLPPTRTHNFLSLLPPCHYHFQPLSRNVFPFFNRCPSTAKICTLSCGSCWHNV